MRAEATIREELAEVRDQLRALRDDPSTNSNPFATRIATELLRSVEAELLDELTAKVAEIGPGGVPVWPARTLASQAASQAASPAEVLASHVVLSAWQVALVLGLTVSKGRRVGEPDPRQVLALVERGKLRPVDPDQPMSRWTFSKKLVEAYVDDPGLVIIPGDAAAVA